MRKRIHKYDNKNGVITVIHNDRYLNLYLTNSIKRRFSDLLQVGSYIEFKTNFNNKKIINKKKCFQINHFLNIKKPTFITTKVIYDIADLRKKIISDITKDNYYMFLDLEMTMPPYYRVKNFQTEIIQVGYFLTDNKQKIIKKNDYYLKPSKFKTISKRTLKFLNIKRDTVKNPTDYAYFYEDLKKIISKYNPKIVVWGKNDYLAIENSFKINKEKPLIDQTRIINLLKQFKRYYNLFNDVGLFNVYEIFYNETPEQKHDALSDAYVLLQIYKTFIKEKNFKEQFSKFE